MSISNEFLVIAHLVKKKKKAYFDKSTDVTVLQDWNDPGNVFKREWMQKGKHCNLYNSINVEAVIMIKYKRLRERKSK